MKGRAIVALLWLLLAVLCCGVDIGDVKLSIKSWMKLKNTLHCWTSREGNWTSQPNRPPLISKTYSNDRSLVTKVYSACGPVENRKGLDYWWTPPSSCPPLKDFSFPAMCRAMRGRHLIFTGDSLSLHNYETTLSALGNRTRFGVWYDNHEPHHWQQAYDCETDKLGRNFSVIYLSWNNIVNRHHFSSLTTLSAETGGAVLVANWGAFVNQNESVKAHMKEIIDYVSTKTTNITFIFRASNMAHTNCEDYKVPDNIMHPPSPAIHRRWRWELFPTQNELWEQYIDAHEPGKIFLDIFPMVSKRPDQHPSNYDCLHYCVPGPIDTWTILIYNLIDLIESLVAEDERGHVDLTHEDSHSLVHATNISMEVEFGKQLREVEEKVTELQQVLVEEKKKNRLLQQQLRELTERCQAPPAKSP